MQRVRTSRPAIIEVKISKECVGIVIGRGGSTIKDIQEKTDTRISFKDECKHFYEHRCEDNTEMKAWTGFVWLRIGFCGGFL
jgi:polyribonucleotide nucleotidyltransferase